MGMHVMSVRVLVKVSVRVLRSAGVKWHLTAWLYVHSGGDERESIVL